MSSSTIASWRVGHVACAVVALGCASELNVVRPSDERSTLTCQAPPLMTGLGGVAREHEAARLAVRAALDGTDEARSRRCASAARWWSRRATVAAGRGCRSSARWSTGWRRADRAAAAWSWSWSARSTRGRCSAGSVDAGPLLGGGRRRRSTLGRRRPGGAAPSGAAVGGRRPRRSAGGPRRSRVRRRFAGRAVAATPAPRRVAAVAGADGGGRGASLDGVLDGSSRRSASVHGCITGRNDTMPATSTASSASRWSFTPGRSTTMFSPSTRTSGSAMPRFSSSSRIRSRITSRSSRDAPPSGARITEMPPCRSRPSTGLFRASRLAANSTTAMVTIPTSEISSRRRFIRRIDRQRSARPANQRRGADFEPTLQRRAGRPLGRLPGGGGGAGASARLCRRRRGSGVVGGHPPEDGVLGHADLHVVVDLDPDDVVVLVDAGDEPVHARREQHLVADRRVGAQLAWAACCSRIRRCAGAATGSRRRRRAAAGRRSSRLGERARSSLLSSVELASVVAVASATVPSDGDELSAGSEVVRQ